LRKDIYWPLLSDLLFQVTFKHSSLMALITKVENPRTQQQTFDAKSSQKIGASILWSTRRHWGVPFHFPFTQGDLLTLN
jgi:hypothetical protein